MGAEALLHAAVINNARWCDAVCRSHGYPGEFGGRLWISAGHALPFYPNAITLSPDITAAEATAGQDPSRPFSIKDSFARLDLVPHGLTPLFDAEWIALPPPPVGDDQGWDTVATQGELARWEAAWAGGGGVTGLFQSALLADPDCAILACHRDGSLVGGATTYTTDGVTGILNVFKIGIAACELLTSAVRAVATLRPGLPIVGYEQGEDFVAARAAGFRVLGPLRIWARSCATTASACSRVNPRLRLDIGTTRLPPAKKTTLSVRQARRSGYRSAIAICSRSMASCLADAAGTTRSS
jgi:hypothetical protein